MSASPRRPATAFEERVYALTRKIPRGKVATYGAVGRALGCGSAQAIGQALRRNPYAPETPCHRVVASTGALNGFNGARSDAELTRKRRLLEEEGVEFDAAGRVAARCLLRELGK